MCDNNAIDKRLDKKPGLLSPLIGQASAAAPKVFILMPEILQNLGLTGHTNIRIASNDALQKIDLAAIISQAPREQTANDKNKCITANPIVEEMPSSADKSIKRRRDSKSDKNLIIDEDADDATKPLKLVESTSDVKQKENGINSDSIAVKSKLEESIAVESVLEKSTVCTVASKAKRGRRKSNISNLQSDRLLEVSNKQISNESKKQSNLVVPGNEVTVRTSKRVAKPKKFEDYVVSRSFKKAQERAANHRASIEKRELLKLSVTSSDKKSLVSKSQNEITDKKLVESSSSSRDANVTSGKHNNEQAVTNKSEVEIERLVAEEKSEPIKDLCIQNRCSAQITGIEKDVKDSNKPAVEAKSATEVQRIVSDEKSEPIKSLRIQEVCSAQVTEIEKVVQQTKEQTKEQAIETKSETEIQRIIADEKSDPIKSLRIQEICPAQITEVEKNVAKLDVEATTNTDTRNSEDDDPNLLNNDSLNTEDQSKDCDDSVKNAEISAPALTVERTIITDEKENDRFSVTNTLNSIVEEECTLSLHLGNSKSNDGNEANAVEDIENTSTEYATPRRKGRPRTSWRSVKALEKPATYSNEEERIEVTEDSVDTENVASENLSRTDKSPPRNEDEAGGMGLSEESEIDNADYKVEVRRSRGRPYRRGRSRGRGRRRGNMDSEYIPRNVSSNPVKKDPNNSEKINDQHSQNIECGKCKEEMPKKEWMKHNMAKHNGMGWLAGATEPDFQNDIKLLRSVLTATIKKKKGSLKCENCNAEKRSANGFISHLQFCGKTEEEREALMMTCPVCKAVMMPSSMEMHERFHRQIELDEKKKLVEEVNGNESRGSRESSRGKRKAAEKAATKISEFTGLVKEDTDEPEAKKRRRYNIEFVHLINKSQRSEGPPNIWKGIWKNELTKNGKAVCRHGRCNFSATSIEQLCDHYSVCEFRPQVTFSCKICKFSSVEEENLLSHIKEKHSDVTNGANDPDFESESSSYDDDNDDTDYSENDKPQKSQRSSQVGYRSAYHKKQTSQFADIKFLDDEPPLDGRLPIAFTPALRWTMEFESKNYRLSLFEDLLPNSMNLLELEESLKYIPKLEKSMAIKQIKAKEPVGKGNDGWKIWERFEGTVYKGVPTFFTGGPVWAVAWLPIPAPMYKRNVDQYVAVSTHSSMDIEYLLGKPYDGKNIIQLWNLGHLDHGKNYELQDPVLSYCVAHDSGTVWSMEWCPSGCYQHSDLFDNDEIDEDYGKRMGLLAAGCSDGCVHIFSLPFPDYLDLANKDNQHDSQRPIYRTKPVVTLVTNTLMYEKGEQKWQCVKINWSRECGHDVMICGFSNGYVALWDLKSKSPLFVTKRGDTTFIDAFHHFYAHGHAVTCAQLIPYGGKRFFLTASYDRWAKLWDLEDTTSPITAIKRGLASDAAWMTHWPSFLTSYDDVYGLGHTHTYLMSLRHPGNRILPMMPTNSPIFNIAVSDYGNSVGQGTSAGEVLVAFHHQLWNPKEMDKDLPKKRWLASTVEIVDLKEDADVVSNCDSDESKKKKKKKKKNDDNYVYLPDTYDACKDRFRIVFRDTLVRTKHNTQKDGRWRPPRSDKMATLQVEQYPFASVNRVSWNPNSWSYLWFCVGYQNGLVRFLNFKTMSIDKELHKLLPSHAKSMLATRKSNNRRNTSDS